MHIREFAKLMRIKGSRALPGGLALATRSKHFAQRPANPGSFNTQNHSIGPTLFITFGGDDDSKGGDDNEGKAGGDDKKAGKPEVSEFTLDSNSA